ISFFALSGNNTDDEFYPTPNASRAIISVGNVSPTSPSIGTLDPANPSNNNIVNVINGDVTINYNSAWTEYVITFQVPSSLTTNPDYIYFGVCPIVGSTENTYTYFDDISLYEQNGNVTGGNTVCKGATLQLNSTFSGTWSSSNNFAATVTQNGLVTGIGTGTTYITCTDGTNCKKFSTFVRVVASPALTPIQGINALCSGTTFSALTSTPTGGSWLSSDPNSIFVDPLTGEITAGTGYGATITYTYTNSQCTSSVSKYIPIKTIALIPNHILCLGLTEVASGTLSSGQYWYSTDINVATVDPVTGLIETLSPGITQIGINGFKDGSNCPREIQFKLTVLAAPTINGISVICSTQSAVLTSSIGDAEWYFNGINLGVITTNYTTNALGEYKIISSEGCFSEPVKVISGETISPQISGPNSVCVSSPTSFTATPTGGVWSIVGGRANITQSGVVTGTSAGSTSIKYTVTSRAGCSKTVSKVITVNALPQMPSVAFIGSATNINTGNLVTATCGGGYRGSTTFSLAGSPTGGIWSSTGPFSFNSFSNTDNPIKVVTSSNIGASCSVKYTVTVNGC
ncbi:MAG: Ig-like domain-containing protein, partial [Dolichospermum sp.]